MNKLIVRIKGGLGNQLYCYATARRLAYHNNADLIIDDVSGFKRDYLYNRKYTLDVFKIPCRKASPLERLEPFERARRGIRKKIQNLKKFENRNYIEQEFDDFDKRLLAIKLKEDTCIDGLWQSENYFKDIESVIRQDLEMKPPTDIQNLNMAKEINALNSVAVHVRWFDNAADDSEVNVGSNYYQRAVDKIETMLDKPHFFVFSDNPQKAREKIVFPEARVIFVTHNNAEEKNAIWDFWLMEQCKHFIIANSTFSWWAAWLGSVSDSTLVIFPRLPKELKSQWAWDYEGQMPNKWLPIQL